MTAPETRIEVLRPEQIDTVRHLWLALYAEHRRIGPPWADWWDPATTWTIRQQRYKDWLAEPDAFALGAYRGGALVGYLVARFMDGPDDTWVTGERIGDIESLAVAPDERGTGVGSGLLEAARARMRALDVHDLWIGVVHGNERALNFYERHGLRPLMVTVGSTRGLDLENSGPV